MVLFEFPPGFLFKGLFKEQDWGSKKAELDTGLYPVFTLSSLA